MSTSEIRSTLGRRARVLLVEDDEETRLALVDVVRELGHDVESRESAEAALVEVRNTDFDAVVSDIRMSGMSGIELCTKLSCDAPYVPVVVMTAFGDVNSALSALRAGASDFITKPFTIEQVASALDRVLERRHVGPVISRLPSPDATRGTIEGLVGSSPAMCKVRELIALAAASDSTVLITGESGTGKELVARALHAESTRRAGPFVALSCAALPTEILETELFGHVRGAFTGAADARPGLLQAADKGTLFLDEIGDMPLELQPKLLRAIEQHTVRPVGGTREIPFDARVVAATNRDLSQGMTAGWFREDLFFRLSATRVQIPPLRERDGDARELVGFFLTRLSERDEREYRLDGAAEEALLCHDWPGNVRELENCLLAAAALADNPEIGVAELPASVRSRSTQNLTKLSDIERRHIVLALRVLGWNKRAVARELGIDRATLYRKMKRYGLDRSER